MCSKFSFEDDKKLVQLVRSFVGAGTRVSWKDIGRKMMRTRHTATALQGRMQTLKRTWGPDISRFPPCFFTSIRRPRGRPPAVTRQLRALAGAVHEHSALGSAPAIARVIDHGGGVDAAPRGELARAGADDCKVPAAVGVHDAPDSEVCAALGDGVRAALVDGVRAALGAGVDAALGGNVDAAPGGGVDATLDDGVDAALGGDVDAALGDGVDAAHGGGCVMSHSKAQQSVHDLFAKIPRELVLRDQHEPQRNAGEVLPQGISTLVTELAVDTDDMFLDIEAGVGNVVAQVALGTSAYLSIGIELRTDIYALGTRMMTESAYATRLRERTLFACRNVVDIALSREKPYANATIVLWNNLLFEQSVIEYVKDQLCGMEMIRYLVSSMNLCPRHRASCSRGFCIEFELEKDLQLPCSWKADLLRAFVYKAKIID